VKKGSGFKLTRNRSILVVLYAVYIAFILVSAVPYLAENVNNRGEKVGDKYEYHVVLESDGDDVAHYFDIVRDDPTAPGTIDLEYSPSTHTLNVDISNIRELKLDCESFYKDEAEFLLGETYSDNPEYYKEWFIQGGDNYIDPFTVNVDSDTAMTKLVFDGIPEPYEVYVDSVEEWWQTETNIVKSSDMVTISNVPATKTLVEIYFQSPDNQAPTADFTSPSSALINTEVTFDASGSSDPDGDTLTYSWDFGDGSGAGSGISPKHTYTSAGDFTVELTVSDGKGGADSKDKSITILEEGENPTASFSASKSSAKAKEEITFDAGDSFDDDGSISSYSWDFNNDGIEDATGKTTSTSFPEAGTYTVKLTVTDNDGLTDSATTTITITAAGADDDDDDDEDEGMLGMGKVGGIDLFLLLLIIIIIVIIIIIAGVASAGKKKKKAEEEKAAAAAAAAAAQAPPPTGAEMPPEQPPMYPEQQPPMYEEQPPMYEQAPMEEQPPMYEEQPPMEEAPGMMPPEGEPMAPMEEEAPAEDMLPPEGEGEPLPEETGELPEEPGEELPETEEELPEEPGEELPEEEPEAPPAEEPAAEEQPAAEGGEVEMTTCPACNGPIQVGAPMCPSCHSEFEW
jgi:PKD repeat protein